MRRALAALAIAAIGCGTAVHEPDAGDACEPLACAEATECGAVDDGCGGTLECACPDACATDADCGPGTYCDLSIGRCTSECRRGSHVAVDIPRQEVTLDLTVGGEPLPVAPTEGELFFWTEAALEHWTFGARAALYDESGAVDATPVTLAPGDYRLLFDPAGSLGAPWPAGPAWIGSVHVEPETTRLAIDIPSDEVTLRVTLDGAAVPATGGARIVVHAPSAYSRPTPIATLFLGAGAASIHTLRLAPGIYELHFERGAGAYADWPVDGVLPAPLVVEGPGTIDVDIPVADTVIALTHSGAPAPDGVELQLRPEGSFRGSPGLPLPLLAGGECAFRVLPGNRYDIVSVGGPGDWPPGEATLASLALDADSRVPVDVETITAMIDARLASGPADACGASRARVGARRDGHPDPGRRRSAQPSSRHDVRGRARPALPGARPA